jgi:RNA polymerase sigma factor (sigma-70 family)
MGYSPRTSQVAELLDLWQRGDQSARSRLIAFASDRLGKLARAMLMGNPLHRFEGSDDLMQQTLVRLNRCIDQAQPTTASAVLALAAVEMRRALIDFARHYFGSRGIGSNEVLQPETAVSAMQPPQILASGVPEPNQAVLQAENLERLYAAVDDLAEEERQVVDLLWIHDLTQLEAAAVLGIAPRTVGRRWRRARVQLYEALREEQGE